MLSIQTGEDGNGGEKGAHVRSDRPESWQAEPTLFFCGLREQLFFGRWYVPTGSCQGLYRPVVPSCAFLHTPRGPFCRVSARQLELAGLPAGSMHYCLHVRSAATVKALHLLVAGFVGAGDRGSEPRNHDHTFPGRCSARSEGLNRSLDDPLAAAASARAYQCLLLETLISSSKQQQAGRQQAAAAGSRQQAAGSRQQHQQHHKYGYMNK